MFILNLNNKIQYICEHLQEQNQFIRVRKVAVLLLHKTSFTMGALLRKYKSVRSKKV